MGAKVILVQDRPVLGGNASSEVRMHIVGADGGRRGQELTMEAREGGIIEEIRLECTVRNPQRAASMLDLILYEKCRAEPNLTLLLNTTLTEVEIDGDRTTHAICDKPATEERFRIEARTFIDCTGDGRLAAEANVPFTHGREDKVAHGEEGARDIADSKTLGSTLLFQARKHDRPMPFLAPPWVRTFTPEELRLRLRLDPNAVDAGLEYGFWWVEWGGQLDTIQDNDQIRDELLAIMLGVWLYIKNSGYIPDTDNWALDWFGFLPGKRESRRFHGRHILTEQDILACRDFPDTIAFGGWPLDLHPPEGVDAPDEPPCTKRDVPHLYNIPLSACLAKNRSNVAFAGRNLSATHVAFASTRVMATCAVVGEGLGTAAAFALQENSALPDLASDSALLPRLHTHLLRNDAYLVGRNFDDPADLARRAKVSASSEQPNSLAANVLSPRSRSAHGTGGEPEDRALPGTHRWRSDPNEKLPAWLQLDWPAPVSIAELRLVFDTGQHRHLTLSHSDAYLQKMIWGQPQPETLRDFDLVAHVEGTHTTIATVRGNYQRWLSLVLPRPITTAALRVHVLATNGLDHARLISLRAYDTPQPGRPAQVSPGIELAFPQ